MRPTDRHHPLRELSAPHLGAGLRAFQLRGLRGEPCGGVLLTCPPCHGQCNQGRQCPAHALAAPSPSLPLAHPPRRRARRSTQYLRLMVLLFGTWLLLALAGHLLASIWPRG